jgi:hypothetical protein
VSPGAVQWVHQPERAGRRRDAAGGDLLLGNHGNVGCRRPQAGGDDRLGGAIRLRHRRAVCLALYAEAGAPNAQDRLAGLDRQAGGQRHEIVVVHGFRCLRRK